MNMDCVLSILLYTNQKTISQNILIYGVVDKIFSEYYCRLLCLRFGEKKYKKYSIRQQGQLWYDKYKKIIILKYLFNIIKNCSLHKINNIISIKFNDMNLKQIPCGVFELINLKHLILSNNEITIISSDIVKLKKLISLELQHNNLIYVPEDNNNFSVEHMIIPLLKNHSNNSKVFPIELYGLINLTSLDLSNNILLSVPPGLYKLINLEKLKLNNNLIGDISIICKLYNLRILELHNNNISLLSTNISKLNNLRYFDCSCNNIIFLPVQLYSLSKLTDLILADNNITSLSEEIFKLKELTKLDLSNNMIDRLPRSIHVMTKYNNLKEVLLHNNDIYKTYKY